MVKIASINIACSGRDEKLCPLWKRLPILCQLLADNKATHNFDILCVQEIRATGVSRNDGDGPLSAYDVAYELAQALSDYKILTDWEFVIHKVNPRAGSFYRATFWNTSKWVCHDNRVINSANSEKPSQPFMLMASSFTSANSTNNQTEFKVLNCHAPMTLEDKKLYWQLMHDLLSADKSAGGKTVAIGDVNKFEEHLSVYRDILTAEFEDRVVDVETFVSFEGDTMPDGISLWHSCLDAVVTDRCHRVAVTVVPTIVAGSEQLRPSDHFLIVADVQFADV